MRKIVLIAIAMFTFTFAKAQEKVVKIHPVALAFNVISVDYEQAVSDKNSFEVGLSYYHNNFSGILGNDSGYEVTSFGLEGGYRFYFSKNNDAPEGVYAAPFAGFNSISTTYPSDFSEYDDSGMSFGGGVKGGYQWIHDSGFVLDAYLGYGYFSGGVTSVAYGNGGAPKFGLALGYAF